MPSFLVLTLPSSFNIGLQSKPPAQEKGLGDVNGAVKDVSDPGAVTSMPSPTPANALSLTLTNAPSLAPTASPRLTPTSAPSAAPSPVPSMNPSSTASLTPTHAPSLAPYLAESMTPSDSPSMTPTTDAPTLTPTNPPTLAASPAPSMAPVFLTMTNSPTEEVLVSGLRTSPIEPSTTASFKSCECDSSTFLQSGEIDCLARGEYSSGDSVAMCVWSDTDTTLEVVKFKEWEFRSDDSQHPIYPLHEGVRNDSTHIYYYEEKAMITTTLDQTQTMDTFLSWRSTGIRVQGMGDFVITNSLYDRRNLRGRSLLDVESIVSPSTVAQFQSCECDALAFQENDTVECSGPGDHRAGDTVSVCVWSDTDTLEVVKFKLWKLSSDITNRDSVNEFNDITVISIYPLQDGIPNDLTQVYYQGGKGMVTTTLDDSETMNLSNYWRNIEVHVEGSGDFEIMIPGILRGRFLEDECSDQSFPCEQADRAFVLLTGGLLIVVMMVLFVSICCWHFGSEPYRIFKLGRVEESEDDVKTIPETFEDSTV